MATSSRKNSETNDYSTEEKIVALYELQKIDSKIDEINKVKGELPLEVQDLEDEITGLETRIANITTEIDSLTAETKKRKEEIEQAKTMIAKYTEQQDNVRNNREFDALNELREDAGIKVIRDASLPGSGCGISLSGIMFSLRLGTWFQQTDTC